MASKVLSEAATVRMALESSLGSAPSTGWVQIQPNPGGIELDPELETIERDPLSVYASDEKGDIVGLKANVKITQDVNMDLLRLVGTSMFRTNAKHPGGSGTAFFRPTAAVDGGGSADSFTVAAGGGLAAGVLIYVLGCANSTNNGLFVVVAGSGSTTIKVATATLVAETLPSNAILAVVGVQAASGDVTVTSGNDLASTVLDFTAYGLVKGMAIIVGDEDTTHRFGTLPSTSPAVAYLSATPTTNALTLTDRNWTVGGVDAGTSKTIRLFFGMFFCNRPLNDSDYLEPTAHLELEDQRAATSNTVPVYTYGKGCALGMITLTAPLKQKITAELAFVGTDIPDPVLTASRSSGPSSAYAPLTTSMFDTSNDLEEVKLLDSNGSLVAEVNSWKLVINNNVKPREVQGTLGAIDHIFGKFRPNVTFEGYFNDYDQIKAARANRNLRWRAFIGNEQGGFALRMPYTALRQPKKAYAANDAVMLSGGAPGFKDPDTNTVMSMTLFGYVPFGGGASH